MLSIKPRVAFLIAVLAGTVGIVIGHNSPNPSLAPALTCSVMLIYGLWVWRKSADVRQTEQLADSFYYLGFILTLVALITSLIPGKNSNLLLIFGSGLITTAVGLAGRLLLSQFQDSGAQSVDIAEQQLADKIREVTFSINETNRYLNDVRIKSFQEMTDRLTEGYKMFGSTLSGIQGELNILRDQINLINKSTERHFENLEIYSRAAKESTNSIKIFSAQLQEIGPQLEGLTEVIRLQQTCAKSLSDEVSKQLEDTTSRKEKLEHEVQQAHAAVQQVHKNLIDCSKFIIARLSSEKSNEAQRHS